MRVLAQFIYRRIDHDRRRVWIEDQDGPRSVTNDAEAVCCEINSLHPGYRIFCRDTIGDWDELAHCAGQFIGFAPARALASEEGLT
ncbi:hypothetical protein SAMN02745126_06381 [Enhydrobacter aerosaccus]|uniref:Uncharacterized protein n=1 Tax=Enhydrobacter aerosaccus TaxID=225324 RepID=A0A1T4TJJ8_9HYPH|nr:hypothetical protein [Enhydrobacter aerosaccus]SKA40574.1 hypothetical protein SAMN02745126_06381 [Enhydrobacter aerosaccus]